MKPPSSCSVEAPRPSQGRRLTRTTDPPHSAMSMNVSAVQGFESAVATVAFVDLAGFSAITDVYGDASAIAVLGRFEELVSQALGGLGPPIKWIGDEAMFGFPDPATALQVLGRLIPASPIGATDSADKDRA